VFNNTNTSTGFEADNFSVRTTSVSTDPGTVISGVSSVPEPSTLTLAAIGGLGAFGVSWARKRLRSRTA